MCHHHYQRPNQMKTKKFDKKLFDECDPPAREAVVQFIKREWGLDAKPYDQYKIDLIVYKADTPIGYVEVERRGWWWVCPYPSLHIPQRKAKLFDTEMKSLYFVVAKGLKNAMYCNVKDILNSPLEEIPNREISQGEYFYNVPLNCFIHVQL